jgi:hypothetical protein
VRFMQNNALVIGVVAYVYKSESYPYEWVAVTDKGVIPFSGVLETRQEPPHAD